MSLEIIWEPFGVYRRFFGVIDSSDLVAAANLVHSDERFNDCTYSINDFLGATDVRVDVAEIYKLSLQTIRMSLSKTNIRLAVIATHPDTIRLAEIFISPRFNPYPSKIVFTISEAREWVSADLSTSI